MRFEWDPAKAAANIVKHGVSFRDGRLVFRDPDRVTLAIARPGLPEARFMTIGASGGFTLVAVWTPRQRPTGLSIRIMSVRRAHESERILYPAHP